MRRLINQPTHSGLAMWGRSDLPYLAAKPLGDVSGMPSRSPTISNGQQAGTDGKANVHEQSIHDTRLADTAIDALGWPANL